MQLGELFFNLGFKSTGATEVKNFENGVNMSHKAVEILSDAVDHLVFLLEEMAVKMGAVTRGDIEASKQLIKEDKAIKALEVSSKGSNETKKKKISIIGVLNKKMKDYWGSMNAARIQVMAISGALTYFTKKASDAAVHIDKIASVTGLSHDSLQRMGDAAAQTGGNIDDMAGAVGALQKQSMDIMMGRGGNMGVYNLLGLNPHEDPITLLDKLGKKLKSLPAAYGANLARELGMSDDMIYFLKNVENIKPPREETIVTEKELTRLKQFNFYFNRVFEQGKRVLMKLGAFLTPFVNQIVYFFDRVGTLSGKALNAIEPYMKKIEKFMPYIALAASALFAAFFPVTAAFMLFALILEDIASYVAGDDSVLGRMIKYITNMKGLTKDLIDLWIQLRKLFSIGGAEANTDIEQQRKNMTENAPAFWDYVGKIMKPDMNSPVAVMLEEYRKNGGNGPQGATNTINVNIQGIITDPRQMERAANAGVTNALYQRPAGETK